MMKILLLEPFYRGSHKAWCEGLRNNSIHSFDLLSLPGRHWKWRMHGAAVTMARKYQQMKKEFDLILASDMLDLTTFLALTRHKSHHAKTAVYFHENQLTYPWPAGDEDVKLQRDNHYSFINYTSALAADRVFFNSHYHKESFIHALPAFLNGFPDYQDKQSVADIKIKSTVLPLGIDLKKFDSYKPRVSASQPPTILWNHRWEYDKNPWEFFEVLFQLQEEGIEFQLIVLGENYTKSPSIFKEAHERLKDHIIHFGYAEYFRDYARLLWQADILPVTSNQDFFGGSVVEAIYCNCFPILPSRLAYPEHIPKVHHHRHFYSNKNELTETLKNRIKNIHSTRKINTSGYVAHYDWNQKINQYDKAFESLMDAD